MKNYYDIDQYEMYDDKNKTFLLRKYRFEIGLYIVDVADNRSRITVKSLFSNLNNDAYYRDRIWIPRELPEDTTEESIEKLLMLME